MSQLNIREDFAFHQPAAASDLANIDPALSDVSQRTVYADIVAIRQAMKSRSLRNRFFNPKLFSDPAWDMLLELSAASIVGRRTTLTRLVNRTGIPMTTVMRWIVTLEREGLVTRFADRLDRRQIFLELTPRAHSALASYFNEIEDETTIF